MRRLILLLLLCFCLGQNNLAEGALLYSRSNTLSTSAVSVQATHDITFRNPTTIPVSGKIVFTPTPGEFSIPTGLYYRDVDLLINGVQQPLSSTPGSGSGSPHGVNVVTGTNGTVTLTLNDSTSIAADSTVKLIIGPGAVYEMAGTLGITNPSSIGSRLVTIHTEDSFGTPLDTGGIGLAITIPVGIAGNNTATTAETPAVGILSPGEGGYIPPVGSTNINGAIGGTVAGRCDTGATITLLIPPNSWPSIGMVQLSCLPWSSFEPKTGAPTGRGALADTIFGVTVTTSSGEPIPYSLKPLTIILTYTPGQKQTFSNNVMAFSFNPKLFWRTTDGNLQNNPPERFYVTTNRLEPITLLGQSTHVACADLPADLNCDSRVNSTDLSILMYYWGSTHPGLKADINKDQIVNLVDFSALLYWWTN
ncbi:MAG: hypothetical protein JNK33_05100 [Candidatus Doudnabacteria bacterium]|nr:hypothetical protein [Candidatus Doudnabacteria bacterium]